MIKGVLLESTVMAGTSNPTRPLCSAAIPIKPPQIEPQPDGDLWRLFEFIRIPDEGTQLLLLTWIVACFILDISHPIVNLHGV